MINQTAQPATPVQHFVRMPELPLNRIVCGDNCEVMRTLPSESIDLVVTSPPYDDLRTYGGHEWDFYGVAWNLKRLLKDGGVIVWNVNEATKDGSETGSSMRQALHFQSIGLRLHDTMIYRKVNPMPLTHNRYEQEWEYVFVLSKGKPARWNPLMKTNVTAGTSVNWSTRAVADNAARRSREEVTTTKDESQRGNVFEYVVAKDRIGDHPAPFPYEFARDMITTWTNEGDIVLDPFSGSGTTVDAARELGRNYIGIEINPEYCKITEKRLTQQLLFGVGT
jgi:site-specific DNA-methyltransferase (adenine-specific)